MEVVCVDTNVLLRFLRKDDLELFERARDLFLRAQNGLVQIYLDEIVLAEAIWVLKSFYKVPKEKMVEELKKLIAQSWIVNPRKSEIFETLSLFGSKNISFIDAWVYTVSQSMGARLATFDKKLGKLKS